MKGLWQASVVVISGQCLTRAHRGSSIAMMSRAMLESRQGELAHYFFKTPALHHLVVMKEALRYDEPTPSQKVSRSPAKLYVPYNAADIYEGGRSIFLHSPNLLQVLHEQFGVDHSVASAAGIGSRSKNFPEFLDELPSLDGFLMRDALLLAGIEANEAYFDVSPEERTAIHEFIRGKMEPLVRAAYGGKTPPTHKVDATDRRYMGSEGFRRS